MDYEVTAVERPFDIMGHDAITAVGNDRDGWAISTRGAIHRIASGRERFYVRDLDTGARVYIAPVRDKHGRTGIRTFVDGRATNHLLAMRMLRACSVTD